MARETLEQKAMRIAQETGLDPVNVLQGMQMGDIDFIRAVAPYVNDPADIDTRKARFHGLTEAEAGRTGTYGFKGFSVPKEYSKEPLYNPFNISTDDGMLKQIPKEAGTVNAINEGAASTWGHEYRHQLEQDGKSEIANKYIDLVAAQTPADWKQALYYLRDAKVSDLRNKLKSYASRDNREKTEQKLEKTLKVYGDAIRADTPKTRDALKKLLVESKAMPYIKNTFYNPARPDDYEYPVSRRWKEFVSDDWEKDKEKESKLRKKANTANTFWDAL